MILVTGSGGLIGSTVARSFLDDGIEVLGIDNDSRRALFGDDASVAPVVESLTSVPGYSHEIADVRDRKAMRLIFSSYAEIDAVIHCAAQPSHDWAAGDPFADFDINAVGTLNLLETTRQYSPDAAFVFMSTNKVYGDRPNMMNRPLCGESMSIDDTMHSIFGASKVAADIMVQEYGRYFGMKTVCFRGGCLTGRAHAAVEQHGFLAYLCKCCREGKPYTVYGFAGEQVRDNIHAEDVASAIRFWSKRPGCGDVYNLGGGIANAISVNEAIKRAECATGKRMIVNYSNEARKGDHRWWVTDTTKFRCAYPEWKMVWSLDDIFEELCNG